jgi:hypothetical protein
VPSVEASGSPGDTWGRPASAEALRTVAADKVRHVVGDAWAFGHSNWPGLRKAWLASQVVHSVAAAFVIVEELDWTSGIRHLVKRPSLAANHLPKLSWAKAPRLCELSWAPAAQFVEAVAARGGQELLESCAVAVDPWEIVQDILHQDIAVPSCPSFLKKNRIQSHWT